MCWILSVGHFVKPTEIEEVACDFKELESGEGGNRWLQDKPWAPRGSEPKLLAGADGTWASQSGQVQVAVTKTKKPQVSVDPASLGCGVVRQERPVKDTSPGPRGRAL